jgi:hypothetical protein
MVDDVPLSPALEWKLRAVAIPAAIAIAVAFHASQTGHFLQRVFLSMMVHELGHAVTAWVCGFAAVPTLWKTLIPESRTVVISLAVFATAAWVFVRGWNTARMALAGLGLGIATLHVVGAFGISVGRAHQAIVFGGDAGAMVLGTLLMLSLFAGAGSRLRTGHLRWGFLVIGAAALVDTLSTWWAARSNIAAIPFGEIEGVGLSDPSKLDEVYGWTTDQIVDRYVAVGAACLVVLGAAWIYFTLAARRAALAPDPTAP